MDKKRLVLGLITLAVGLVVCFIGPKVEGKETLICLIGSIIAFVGTQTVVQYVLEKSKEDNDR